MYDVTLLLLAFGAGLLSFISPCNLPLYPAFISYITGMSTDQLKEGGKAFNKQAVAHTLLFLIGFSLIFIVLGMSSSFIGTYFLKYNDFIRQIGAITIFFFGLVILGLIKPKFLMKEQKITLKNRPTGYLGSSLIGIGFAAGWTPCIGPILASVIALSVANPGSGLLYMVTYSLGFSIPFFIMTFFIGKLSFIKKHTHKIVQFGGYMMIIMGIILYFDWLSKISSFLIYNVFNGFTGF
ncbi:cytochrome C biogenesis protein CcdA [Salipaludibacillus neizhouensis]|uniref:Cytochrome C biogenesis protein CcdA n=1 Tax=Salipaludibacillus neizhouensis TaxID=885475 RepID=A0A3A9KY06_9BACI|nr:cytochrome c biogenesis protein CcdA [Salipaludibacillus neizhouensis]RKL69236.1 cytochrome C biogenesis protein CcdA [Salipaludibacillus neizhouensis]